MQAKEAAAREEQAREAAAREAELSATNARKAKQKKWEEIEEPTESKELSLS